MAIESGNTVNINRLAERIGVNDIRFMITSQSWRTA